MKKIIMILFLFFAVACTPSAKYIDEGSCGPDAYYYVEQDGTLRIKGTGAITKEFLSYGDAYGRLHERITRLVIEEGITSIAPEATFSLLDCLEEIILPDTLTGEINEELGHNSHLKHVRIGKSMHQTNAEYMWECEHLETVENNSAYDIPLSPAKGKRTWYVDDQKVETCPPNKTAHAVGNSFTLSFDLNGGQASDLPSTHQYSKETDLPSPEREGMLFMGWYEQSKKYFTGVRFFEQIPASFGKNIKLKAMYAKYYLTPLDHGFKVTMDNVDDFKPYNEVVAFRYAKTEDMKNPIWGDLVAPSGKGEITGLESGEIYYVELFAVDEEWYTDANPEDDVADDRSYHAKQSIKIP